MNLSFTSVRPGIRRSASETELSPVRAICALPRRSAGTCCSRRSCTTSVALDRKRPTATTSSSTDRLGVNGSESPSCAIAGPASTLATAAAISDGESAALLFISLLQRGRSGIGRDGLDSEASGRLEPEGLSPVLLVQTVGPADRPVVLPGDRAEPIAFGGHRQRIAVRIDEVGARVEQVENREIRVRRDVGPLDDHVADVEAVVGAVRA